MPQGTILDPLLFSLYINDIIVGIESEIRLFADDCACFRQIDSIEEKKVREKSRECLNHKPQPIPETDNRQNQTSANRTNVRKTLRLALSSPSEVIAISDLIMYIGSKSQW